MSEPNTTTNNNNNNNSKKRKEIKEEPSLIQLCQTRQWEALQSRVESNPTQLLHLYQTQQQQLKQQQQSNNSKNNNNNNNNSKSLYFSPRQQQRRRNSLAFTTPLAFACRYGAPPSCLHALLIACPQQLHTLLPSRGTPLHEAILCETIGVDSIRILLQHDEQLFAQNTNNYQNDTGTATPISSSTTAQQSSHCHRAALMQDVDGHTPLHLLIRRRSPSHVVMCHNNNNNNNTVDVNASISSAANNTASSAAYFSPRPLGDSSNVLLQQHKHVNDEWMALLELLTKSCPEAVSVPDRGEYEEPPLVMALKAHQYTAAIGDENILLPRMERRIHGMVSTMLQYYPQAASRVFTGARGQYTALHSAVFHGRCAETIQLLLEAEAATLEQPQQQQQQKQQSRAALLSNTQGEIPLHFAAMKGEPPRSMALLGEAAPRAVHQRDATGLTPMHWLWIRFVSTLQSLQDRCELTSTVTIPIPDHDDDDKHSSSCGVGYDKHNDDNNKKSCVYCEFCCCILERGNFESTLNMIRKIDPPQDFFRMRHIPPELMSLNKSNNKFHWAEKTIDILRGLRQVDTTTKTCWTRQEVVSCLFWTKVVSLLKAVATLVNDNDDDNDEKEESSQRQAFQLLQAAVSLPSCPPPVSWMVCLVYQEELMVPDSRGRLALHKAAMRPWHIWDWNDNNENDDNSGENNTRNILCGESMDLLEKVLEASPRQAARVVDNDGRLPLHHTIDTFVKACCNRSRSSGRQLSGKEESRGNDASTRRVIPSKESMLNVIQDLVQRYPDSLERRDGKTKLYPFLQASATATLFHLHHGNNNNNNNGAVAHKTGGESHAVASPQNDEMPMSIAYLLLRENPNLVRGGIPL